MSFGEYETRANGIKIPWHISAVPTLSRDKIPWYDSAYLSLPCYKDFYHDNLLTFHGNYKGNKALQHR